MLEAAQAEFYPKVIPRAIINKASNEPLYANLGGIDSSYGVLVSKKFGIGTTLAAGPSSNLAAGVHYTTIDYSLNQPLLRGFGTEYNLDAVHRAEFSVASSIQGFQQARVATAQEIIRTYYNALMQKQITEINQALAERLRDHVLLTKMKEKRGLTGPMDTYRATIRLKDAEDTVTQSENTYLNLISRLKWLLDLQPDLELKLRSEVPPEMKIVSPVKDAEQYNLELSQFRTSVQESERNARVADNAILPNVALQLNYSQPIAGTVIPPTQQQWSVSVQGSSDLFRSAEKSNAEQARIRSEALQMNLAYKASGIKREIQQQLMDIATAKSRIVLREAQIKEAEGKLALAKVKFSNDMANNFEIMESETELQRAQVSLLESRTDYALSIFDLKAVTGHLLDDFVSASAQKGN